MGLGEPYERFFKRASYYIGHLLTPAGWRRLSDPAQREALFDWRLRAGFLYDTIIDNPLRYRHQRLTHFGHVAHDLRRHELIKTDGEHITAGRIVASPLDEIIGNDPETMTPTRLFDLTRQDHRMTVVSETIDELINWGFLRETTYAAAYERAGRDDLLRASHDHGYSDEPTYQVTPKGNGMMRFLIPQAPRP